MKQEYTKEQYWQVFEKLPNELKSLMLAEETAKDIYDICSRNQVYAELVPEVARYTGRVLMGVILPKDFQEALEKQVGLEKDTAKEVARAVNRQIFFQVKGLLTELQQIEVGEKAPVSAPLKEQQAESTAEGESPEGSVKKPASAKPKRQKKSGKTDSYREPIE